MERVGGFTMSPLKPGCIFDDTAGILPSRLSGHTGGESTTFGERYSTSYGIVYSDEVTLEINGKVWGPLQSGTYFSVPGAFSLVGKGQVAIFERIGVRGVFQIGGPIEDRGRFAYIDGCSNSLLIYPHRLGDPCMNILWLPPKVRQTTHIHPTIRLAMIMSGTGTCVTPDGDLPLKQGSVFCLTPMSQHCFHTYESPMSIVTYHPDSDWGPTDDDAPMKAQTLVSAAS